MQVFVGRPLNVHQLQDLGYDMHRCGPCAHHYDLPVSQVVAGSQRTERTGLPLKIMRHGMSKYLGCLVGQRRTLDNQ